MTKAAPAEISRVSVGNRLVPKEGTTQPPGGTMESREQKSTSNARQKGAAARLKSRHEHYLALACQAFSDNDPVAAENWHQHAEHFFRMLKERGPRGSS